MNNMMKLFISTFAALALYACGNSNNTSTAGSENNTDKTEEVATTIENQLSEAQKEQIIDFLTPIYGEDGPNIFEEKWLKENCTEKCMKYLADQYDYEGEGYAAWLIKEGNAAGEDCLSDLLGISVVEKDNKEVAKVRLDRTCGDIGCIRTLYIGCVIVDDKVKIDTISWGKDICNYCEGRGEVDDENGSVVCPQCKGKEIEY